MKFTIALMALAAASVEAKGEGFAENLNEMFPNKENLWSNDWNKYKKSRQLMVDCDIYESENWLGTGKCKYSW